MDKTTIKGLIFLTFLIAALVGMVAGYYGIDVAYKVDCKAYLEAFNDCAVKYKDCKMKLSGNIWDGLGETHKNLHLNLSIG